MWTMYAHVYITYSVYTCVQCTYIPAEDDDFPEDDGVLHEGEEDEEHAGEQPHLQRCHRVRDRDPRTIQMFLFILF